MTITGYISVNYPSGNQDTLSRSGLIRCERIFSTPEYAADYHMNVFSLVGGIYLPQHVYEITIEGREMSFFIVQGNRRVQYHEFASQLIKKGHKSYQFSGIFNI